MKASFHSVKRRTAARGFNVSHQDTDVNLARLTAAKSTAG